jgi:hypothetical protein
MTSRHRFHHHELGANARECFVSFYEQSRVIAAQADWLEKITRPAAETMPSKSPPSKPPSNPEAGERLSCTEKSL